MTEPYQSDAQGAGSTGPEAANQGIAGPNGVVLDQYVLLEQLSSSRTGLVYKARHRLMGRMVAVKFLSPEAAASESLTARFQRAIKILSRLEHKNLLCAHEASQQNGMLYLVMEYVDGQDLRSMVKQQGPLPVATAVDYARQAATGLAYAHEQGVFHRNIKPGNLLVDRQGVVKIVGFGLAHVEGGGAFDEASLGDGLTRQGQVMGTYDYMAPEQAMDSSRVDARVDIYSLGCTLHNLLTGHAPYVVKSPVQMVLAHRSSPIPSLRASRPEVPESLDRVFQKMLAKQPEDRQASMREVIADLDAAMSGTSLDQAEAPQSEPASSDTMTNLRNILAEHQAAEKAMKSPSPRKLPAGLLVTGLAATVVVLLALIWLATSSRPPVARSKDREEQPESQSLPEPSQEEPFQARPAESSQTNMPEQPPADVAPAPKVPPAAAAPVAEEPKPASKPEPERTLESLLKAGAEPEAPKEKAKAPPEPVNPELPPESKPQTDVLPVPDEAARRKAAQLLRETFPEDFAQARSDEQKSAFAKQLLKQAAEISDDPVGRFVLLETVRKLAIEAREPVAGLKAIDLAAQHYEVEPWSMKVDLLTVISQGPHGAAQRRVVAEHAAQLTAEALEAQQFEAASALNKLAMSEAVKIRDVPMIQQIRTTSKEVNELLDLFGKYQAAKETLKKTPNDPQASLVVGRYKCLVRGGWDAGLPKLAAGSDQAIRNLAAKDLAKPDDVDQQVAVGDGWWELAQGESGVIQANLYRRAAYWYEKAALTATGLLKTKLDKRLETIRARETRETNS
jgi:serine/threonine protein kinase